MNLPTLLCNVKNVFISTTIFWIRKYTKSHKLLKSIVLTVGAYISVLSFDPQRNYGVFGESSKKKIIPWKLQENRGKKKKFVSEIVVPCR